MDENPIFLVQKAALLAHLREALREAGYDAGATHEIALISKTAQQ